MRLRHNKKRNTAFLYEALLRELTKSVIKQNKFKIKQIGSIIKENFSKETLLFKELSIYKPLYETSSIPRDRALRLIQESRLAHGKLDKKRIFEDPKLLAFYSWLKSKITNKKLYSVLLQEYNSIN